MNIPVIIPYTDERETEEIAKVIDSGWVAQGPKVVEFERLVAEHEGIVHGIATTSCTTALHLAMHAIGIGVGNDILVPSFTFVASANSIFHTGAMPRFVDIKQDTFCIDSISVRQYIDKHYIKVNDRLVNKQGGNILVAIMVVHQFGLCADMSALSCIANEYSLRIIEDSACALGAMIGDKHQGAFGNLSCLSFHPRKSITTGEGGMILTDDDELARQLKSLRSHGAAISALDRHNYKSFALSPFDRIGYNYRMTDIQAAMGIAQMEKFDFILDARRKRAARYNELLSEFGWLIRPVEPEGYFHTYQSYVCMIRLDGITTIEGGKKRDRLIAALAEKGIATRQGAHASHMLECYQKMYDIVPDDIPNSCTCDRLSITLPLYVQMTDAEQDYVVEQLREGYLCLV